MLQQLQHKRMGNSLMLEAESVLNEVTEQFLFVRFQISNTSDSTRRCLLGNDYFLDATPSTSIGWI